MNESYDNAISARCKGQGAEENVWSARPAYGHIRET